MLAVFLVLQRCNVQIARQADTCKLAYSSSPHSDWVTYRNGGWKLERRAGQYTITGVNARAVNGLCMERSTGLGHDSVVLCRAADVSDLISRTFWHPQACLRMMMMMNWTIMWFGCFLGLVLHVFNSKPAMEYLGRNWLLIISLLQDTEKIR